MKCWKGQVNVTCKVILLDQQEFSTEATDKTLGKDLLNEIFRRIGVHEVAYFGLRYIDSSNQTQWLDLARAVRKQVKNSNCTFYFGVKFYVVDPCKLNEESTRYQFFLQIKQDILQASEWTRSESPKSTQSLPPPPTRGLYSSNSRISSSRRSISMESRSSNDSKSLASSVGTQGHKRGSDSESEVQIQIAWRVEETTARRIETAPAVQPHRHGWNVGKSAARNTLHRCGNVGFESGQSQVGAYSEKEMDGRNSSSGDVQQIDLVNLDQPPRYSERPQADELGQSPICNQQPLQQLQVSQLHPDRHKLASLPSYDEATSEGRVILGPRFYPLWRPTGDLSQGLVYPCGDHGPSEICVYCATPTVQRRVLLRGNMSNSWQTGERWQPTWLKIACPPTYEEALGGGRVSGVDYPPAPPAAISVAALPNQMMPPQLWSPPYPPTPGFPQPQRSVHNLPK
ncbi:unnamed protein product [Nesidiocoris tenuis]|uniref:FERM domain-containing protein n=1 Tax=Nesidiocoris tenuis TaxID=355587 RepID=A0A6H5HHR9_9HEMI|nr:unnamed protein product [Nesidiocoris tenuis]